MQAQACGNVYAGAVAFTQKIDIEAGTTAGAIHDVVGEVPNIGHLGPQGAGGFDQLLVADRVPGADHDHKKKAPRLRALS